MLHLLCGDILKCESIKKFMSHLIEITKKIRNVQVLHSIFTDLNKQRNTSVTLKLPGITRWGSSLMCLSSFLKSKSSLQQLVVKEETSGLITPQYKNMLLDDNNFWIKIEKLHELLVPIIKWIDLLQSDSCVAHKVYDAIVEIENSLIKTLPTCPISKREEEHILKAFYKRKEIIIQPVHLAAALLDPSNQGFNSTESEQVDAMEAICTIADNMHIDTTAVMTDLANYKAKQGIWSKSFLWITSKTVTPITWWLSMSGTSLLSKVAVKILSIPITSAATERSFSTFSFIHTKKRNRLTTKRAGMITYIAFNWKFINKKSNNLKSHKSCHNRAPVQTETDINENSEENSRQPNLDDVIDLNSESMSSVGGNLLESEFSYENNSSLNSSSFSDFAGFD